MPAASHSRLASIRIRGATDQDGPAIQAIVRAAYAEYPGCVFDLSELPELIAPATAFVAMDGCIWVAETAAEVVGSVALVRAPEPELAELRKLYTLASVRGIDLGRRLIIHGETHARCRGAKRIHLWTDTRFHTAHRVYERLGYRRLPETRVVDDLSCSVEYRYLKTL